MLFKTVRLGILGGGQLGKMLIQEAVNLNLELFVLDPDNNAPCKYMVEHFTCGALTDYDTVYNFGKQVEVLTIEIEHVNVDALIALQNEGVKIYPQPEVLSMVQDKGKQKMFYTKHDIPTAAFVLCKNKLACEELVNDTQKSYMQKLCKGGYDGKGVAKIKSLEDVKNGFDAPVVMEELIDFEKELAVIVTRNASGETAIYDLVEMDFNPTHNLVEFLHMPATVDPSITQKAKEIALKIVNSCNMVGILAVELFLTKQGELLVNEIAPRPHNSGHQTIECCYTSQYAQHLRAVLNLPLGDTSVHTNAVMINLLGEAGKTGEAVYEGLAQAMQMPKVYIHLYGKKITKPFRKMGHVTILHELMPKAKEIALEVKKTIQVTTA